MDEKYRGLKKQLSELTLIPVTQILLVEISGAFIKVHLYCFLLKIFAFCFIIMANL